MVTLVRDSLMPSRVLGAACGYFIARYLRAKPQADRWVAVILRTISSGLDADASDAAWEWLYEGRIETRRALLRGEPCTVSVTHEDIRITWTIRPVVFLPLLHRQSAELPNCAHDFKPRKPD
ncbi:hypothetical protein ACFY8B_16035 [Streptomyces sp. NPDC012751]|uniref:hypothetical protein n=1 Tax=Streptomyces sp. NPDC012751 TaxID=3364846 RepID=UPI0036912A04